MLIAGAEEGVSRLFSWTPRSIRLRAAELIVPRLLIRGRETDRTTLRWDQLGLALAELTLRDRILLELDMTNALRPSELLAFRWKCFDSDACRLKIVKTVYKGKIRP
jgi:integrase